MSTTKIIGYDKIETLPDETGLIHKADTSELKEYMNPRALRRVDSFTRMALLSVKRALKKSEISLEPQMTGLILGSINGPVNTTLRFLDDLIDDGDEFASPTWFSVSVHNAMAAQLALNLDIQGPTRSLTADNETLELSLRNAEQWLNDKVCETVIVCVGDEHSRLFNDKEQQDRFSTYVLSLEGAEMKLDYQKVLNHDSNPI